MSIEVKYVIFFLARRLSTSNRLDIVCRVFKMKLDEMMTNWKKDFLGKATIGRVFKRRRWWIDSKQKGNGMCINHRKPRTMKEKRKHKMERKGVVKMW